MRKISFVFAATAAMAAAATVTLTLAPVARAEEAPASDAPPTHSGITWLNFEALGAMVIPVGEAFTGAVYWTPHFHLMGNLGINADIGVSFFPSTFGGIYVAPDYQAFLNYRVFSGLAAEAGGGFQYWIGAGGIIPEVTGGLAWVFDSRPLGILDRITAKFNKPFGNGASVSTLYAGIGLVF